MNFYISHHQHKGMEIGRALKREKWKYKTKNVDIALFDHAINRQDPESGRRSINSFHDEGSTIITYPHGATGSWWMDSDRYKIDSRVAANLVIGEGHKYIENIIQPTLTHYPIGWPYCDIKEFHKPKEIKKILFAPIHATIRTNRLREDAYQTNIQVFNALLELENRYKISVRYINPLEAIGLYNTPKFIFKAGNPDGSYDDIDDADLVIAEGTFMYLAIARGKPTIGMNQHIPPAPNDLKTESFKLNRWNEYESYMAYPIDFYDDINLTNLIDKAINEEQTEWKNLFIGKQLNSKYLSSLLTDIRINFILNNNK